MHLRNLGILYMQEEEGVEALGIRMTHTQAVLAVQVEEVQEVRLLMTCILIQEQQERLILGEGQEVTVEETTADTIGRDLLVVLVLS